MIISRAESAATREYVISHVLCPGAPNHPLAMALNKKKGFKDIGSLTTLGTLDISRLSYNLHDGAQVIPVSYTHLTLPTICSV